jgi:hypothetical protein
LEAAGPKLGAAAVLASPEVQVILSVQELFVQQVGLVALEVADNLLAAPIKLALAVVMAVLDQENLHLARLVQVVLAVVLEAILVMVGLEEERTQLIMVVVPIYMVLRVLVVEEVAVGPQTTAVVLVLVVVAVLEFLVKVLTVQAASPKTVAVEVQVAHEEVMAVQERQDNLEVVAMAVHMAVALAEVTAMTAAATVVAVRLELYGQETLEHFLLLEQQTNNWR